MSRKKALVVDDSAFMRKMISSIINTSDYVEVGATARNGKDALDKLKTFKPDVITLDVEMPIMDGITTLKKIMDTEPIPIIMLSSKTKSGADKTIEAMELGALDFIEKPSGAISLDIECIQTKIVEKVELAAKTRISPIAASPINKKTKIYKPLKSGKPIVAIGSSTGGPRALQELILGLPVDFQAPIVIVQHMPAGFTKSLADRLNNLAKLKVKEAENGEEIRKGMVYIAQGGKQLRIIEKQNKWIANVKEEESLNGHQPSVDILFASIAKLAQCHPFAVILTGMGSDGAKGVIQLKKHHPRTITVSQSEQTCVVYGMPQAAEKTSLVDYVEDLNNISTLLVQKIQQKG